LLLLHANRSDVTEAQPMERNQLQPQTAGQRKGSLVVLISTSLRLL